MAGTTAGPDNVYEALVAAIGTTTLGDVILQSADDLADIFEVFAFWVEGDGAPVKLASSGHRGSAGFRASLYVGGYHTLDPLLPLIRDVQEQSSLVSASLAARDIPDPLYRRECFERAGLSGKLAFVRTCGQRHYVLSFYGSLEHLLSNADPLQALAEFALPVLKRHGELLGDEVGLPLKQKLERRLARAYPLLTGREREVCARSLAGMTAEATALELGIAETSVLTYRRRAYDRYCVSSASELLESLLD